MKRVTFSKGAWGIGACVFLTYGFMTPSEGMDEIIASPNWEMIVDEYGYSDLALDLRPGYEGREYLSGEWAAAIGYTMNTYEFWPTWLNPDFIYPDWKSNSDFALESDQRGIFNAYGFAVLRSTIANSVFRILITSEMIDTTNGIPQGVAAQSGPAGAFTTSDRYVFRQSFQITNISGEPLSNVKFFKFLHSLQAVRAVYDDRDYGPALNGYRYTVSQQGHDIGRGGASSLAAVHFDTVALQANVPPTSWEVGRYGIEGQDSHEYGGGKPSVGVHWSVESDALSGLDSFSPPEKWVSGAMRFNLGALAPGASTSIVFLMSLRTDTITQTAQGTAWGNNASGQCRAPAATIREIAAGGSHSLGLGINGGVIGWGTNSSGQINVPPACASNVAAIAAGGNHSLALKKDGTVIGWGDNTYHQISVPSGLTGVEAIAAGGNHSLALKNDGTVIGWGDDTYGQANAPAGMINVIAIAAGGNHSLALKNDGTVIGWGDDTYGQANAPAGMINVIAIAAGGRHSLVLQNDGAVLGWGDITEGQIEVPWFSESVKAIAAGGAHSLALMANGTVVGWGDNSYGQTEVPAGLGRVRAIAAGGTHTLALIAIPPALGISRSGQHAVLSWSAAWAPEIEGAILEQANSLLTGGWAEAPSLGTVDGVLFKVYVPTSVASRFFRLRIP
jgi:hypothetical protein